MRNVLCIRNVQVYKYKCPHYIVLVFVSVISTGYWYGTQDCIPLRGMSLQKTIGNVILRHLEETIVKLIKKKIMILKRH